MSKDAIDKELSTRATTWCIWGAALVAMPHIVNRGALLVTPFQTSGIASVLFIAGLLFGLYEGITDAHAIIIERNVAPLTKVCALAGSLAYVCELMSAIPFDAVSALVAYGEPLYVIGRTAHGIALALWALAGLAEIAPSDKASDNDAHVKHCVTGMGLGWFVPLLLWFVTIETRPPAFVGIVLYVLVGFGLFILLRTMANTHVGKGDAWLIFMTTAVGQLCASACILLLSSLMQPMPTPDEPLVRPVIGALILVIAATVATIITTFIVLSQPKPTAPEDAFSEHLIRSGLSDREREVALLAAGGASLSAISEKCGVSKGAAGTYRRRALDKLGFADVDELRSLSQSLRAESAACEEDLSPAEPKTAMIDIATAIVFCVAVAFLISLGGAKSPSTYACAACVLLALVGCARLALLGPTPSSRIHNDVIDSGRFAVSRPLVAAATCAVLPFFVVTEWMSGDLLDAFFGIILAVVVAYGLGNRDESQQTLPTPARVVCRIGRGIRYLAWGMPELPIIASCSFFGHIHLHLTAVITTFAFEAVVVIGLFAVYLARRTINEAALATPSGQMPGNTERAVYYLMGRGCGELQARVMVLSVQGRSRQKICDELCISSGTVSSYRSRGYRILGVQNSDEVKELLIEQAGLDL